MYICVPMCLCEFKIVKEKKQSGPIYLCMLKQFVKETCFLSVGKFEFHAFNDCIYKLLDLIYKFQD